MRARLERFCTTDGPRPKEQAGGVDIADRGGVGRSGMRPDLQRDILEILRDPGYLGQQAIFAQAADEIEKLRARHTDRSVPCPKCGFVIIYRKAEPFRYDDEPEEA